MPLYEYQCEACGNRFEKIVKFSDPPVDACPECGGAVKKLLSSPAIQFKGSGWYITDYAKKPSSDAASGDAAGAKGDVKKGDKDKGDTAKPADSPSKADSSKSDSSTAAAPAAKE